MDVFCGYEEFTEGTENPRNGTTRSEFGLISSSPEKDVAAGRPVFWLPDHPTAEPSQPSLGHPRESGQWHRSAIVPGYSDGLAPDFHRLPAIVGLGTPEAWIVPDLPVGDHLPPLCPFRVVPTAEGGVN